MWARGRVVLRLVVACRLARTIASLVRMLCGISTADGKTADLAYATSTSTLAESQRNTVFITVSKVRVSHFVILLIKAWYPVSQSKWIANDNVWTLWVNSLEILHCWIRRRFLFWIWLHFARGIDTIHTCGPKRCIVCLPLINSKSVCVVVEKSKKFLTGFGGLNQIKGVQSGGLTGNQCQVFPPG